MEDDHLTRDLYEALRRGDLSLLDFFNHAVRHLVASCPTCRAEYEAFLAGRGPASNPELEARAALALLDRWRKRLEDLQESARRDRATLLRLVPKERSLRIQRARTRFRNPLLAELLLDDSREQFRRDPALAVHFAELAQEVAHYLAWTESPFGLYRELTYRAQAYRANGLRIQGELSLAEPKLLPLLDRLDGIDNLEVQAELCSLGASLQRDRRRFEHALQLLDTAISIYHQAGRQTLVGRTYLKKAQVLREMGSPERAHPVLDRALRRLSAAREDRLVLCVHHERIYCWIDADRYRAAEAHLQETSDLYAAFPDFWTQFRYRWARGKIAYGLGRLDEAETDLESLRADLMDREQGYDAILVSLDLALLYAEQNRTEELKTLALEMVPVFQAQDVHREALAALMLFQRAVVEEEASILLVRRLTSYLEQARRDPSLRFED